MDGDRQRHRDERLIMGADDHALVIGINSYGDGIKSLEGCHTDAKKFKEWLESSDGGAVPLGNITMVLSELDAAGNRHPTFDAIDNHVLRLVEEYEDTMVRRGRLYLYFAGHGIQPRNYTIRQADCLVLLANATRRQLSRRNVPAMDTAELFRKIAAFREIVLFVDCCLESADGRIDPGEFSFADTLDELYAAAVGVGAHLVYGVATTENTLSFEALLQGPGDPEPVMRGRFTFALLEGLRCAIDKASGSVTIDSLKGYTSSSMEAQGGPSQVPQFSGGNFVICTPPAKQTNVLVRLIEPARGLEVRRGPEIVSTPLAQVAPDSVLLRLTPGLYELRWPVPPGAATMTKPLEVREEAINVTFP